MLLFYVLYCKQNICSSVQAGKGVKRIFCCKTSTFTREKNLIKNIYFLSAHVVIFIHLHKTMLFRDLHNSAKHQDSYFTLYGLPC